jgi:sugar phosphate permease
MLAPSFVRFIVVALTTVMAIVLYLDRICLAITERYMTHDLELTDQQAGLLLSAFFWTYALGQVPSGWLSDCFGARRMLTLYIVLWSVFTGLMGAAQSFVTLVVLRLGCGLAQAGAYPASGSLLSRWVPFGARAWASGVVSTGGRVGGVAAPVLTAYLMVAFGRPEPDWRPVLVLYGLAGLLVAGFFWLMIRDRPSDHPACNAAELSLIEAGRPSSLPSPHGRVRGIPWGGLLRSRSLWLSSVSQFGTNFGWVFLLTWFPRYLAEVHGVPIEERGWMAGMPILLGMAGMLAGGWATDRLTQRLGLRWGRCLPIALTRFVAMAAYLACLFLDSPWRLTAALSLVAIATDLGTPATWAFIQDVGGRHVGSVLGWGNMWGSLGAALSPLVLNWLIGTSCWDACFSACALAFLVAGIAALGVDATIPIRAGDDESA